jgi:hypothetical protein
MAKVFIVLLSALVVLNGMTFLVVVNQGTAPGQGAPSQADAAARKQGPDPTHQKLESLERTVQGFKGSMDRLSSKVDGLQAKVNQVASRPSIAPAAVEPLPPPSASRAKRQIPAAQRGRIDYSRITTPEAQPAEPAPDEEANDEDAAATAEAQPAAQPADEAAEETAPAEGTAAEGAEGAAGQTPVPEGAEGTTPGEDG